MAVSSADLSDGACNCQRAPDVSRRAAPADHHGAPTLRFSPSDRASLSAGAAVVPVAARWQLAARLIVAIRKAIVATQTALAARDAGCGGIQPPRTVRGLHAPPTAAA